MRFLVVKVLFPFLVIFIVSHYIRCEWQNDWFSNYSYSMVWKCILLNLEFIFKLKLSLFYHAKHFFPWWKDVPTTVKTTLNKSRISSGNSGNIRVSLWCFVSFLFQLHFKWVLCTIFIHIFFSVYREKYSQTKAE